MCPYISLLLSLCLWDHYVGLTDYFFLSKNSQWLSLSWENNHQMSVITEGRLAKMFSICKPDLILQL